MLDRLDRALLSHLAANGRITQTELSERVGLSSTACARRQKSLEEEGYIVGYRAVFGLRRFGFSTTVLVRITLASQNDEALRAFEAAVVKCCSVTQCVLMSGSDDYLLTVIARDVEDFERIHKTQLSTLPRVARIRSSFAVREVVNRSNAPMIVLEEQGS